MFGQRGTRLLAATGVVAVGLMLAMFWTGGGSPFGGAAFAGTTGTPTTSAGTTMTPASGGGAAATPSVVATRTVAATTQTPAAGGGTGGSQTLPSTGTGSSAGGSVGLLPWVLVAASLGAVGIVAVGASAAKWRQR